MTRLYCGGNGYIAGRRFYPADDGHDRLCAGSNSFVLDHGKLYFENLKKAKIDVSEFLVQCRGSGYFDVSKLETAILEGNGKISFLSKVTDRPITPSDVNISPQQDYMVTNVILATCDSSNQVTVFLKSNRRGAKSVHM